MKKVIVVLMVLTMMTSAAFAASGSLKLRKISHKNGVLTFTAIKSGIWSSGWHRKKGVAKEELNDYMCDKGVLKYRGSWQPNTYKVSFTRVYKFLFSKETYHYDETYKFWVGNPYYETKTVNGKKYYKYHSKTPLDKNKCKRKCSGKGEWSVYAELPGKNRSFKFKV